MKQTKKTVRQALILGRVSKDGTLEVSQIAKQLKVSGETIRRDMKEMERKGMLQKVHGGAALPSGLAGSPYQERMRHNTEGKRRIGEAVAQLVANGDSLLIETGTTNMYVAQALREHKNMIIITNSVDVARTLAFRTDNDVFMAGGKLTADDGASLGSTAIDYISTFRVKFAIFSVGAIDVVDGLMAHHISEAEFTRAAIARAEKTILVADQTKFGCKALVRIIDLARVDILVTDAEPPLPFRRLLSQGNVQVVIAS
jgi:DeoR family transcriptional regulator, glycerol-3-phosphate regulon repressor